MIAIRLILHTITKIGGITVKKKILALLLTAALCLSLAVPCFAASKPAVEVMWTSFYMNYVGGVEPTIYFRNNSGKTIKYIDWYLTAYNAVGDPVRCDVSRKSTVIAETVGPIPTFLEEQPLKIIEDTIRKKIGNKIFFRIFKLRFRPQHDLPPCRLRCSAHSI